MNLLMTIGVEKNPISCQVRAAYRSPNDVMAVPAGLCGDLLGADWADSLLRFPQVQQLLSASQRTAHLGSQSLLEVRLPDRIIRICLSTDLDMSPNGDLGGHEEINPWLFSFKVGCFCREGPVVSIVEMEVGFADPMGRFVGMSSSCPLPYNLEDAMIEVAKDCLADYMSVILSPTPDQGIEQPDQVRGLCLGVGFHQPPDFLQQ
jgi:hypothetical protein